MTVAQEIVPVEKCDLVGMVAELFAEGYRLVQIGCSTLPDGYEITYSFDLDYRLRNLRVIMRPGDDVPSISVIYPNAFLYENEIHDLFGVTITHIAVDYRGTLYRTALSTPFSIENVKLPEPPKQRSPASAEKTQQMATETSTSQTPPGEPPPGRPPDLPPDQPPGRPPDQPPGRPPGRPPDRPPHQPSD